MNDPDIRAQLTRLLAPRLQADPTILCRHEMGITAGARRTDLALVSDHIDAYEIKSDADTLNRLADQADAYGRVVDYATLVTTDRHMEAASRLIPEWWGLTLADETHLTTLRAPLRNRHQHPFPLAQLLWRTEALEELTARSCHKPLSKAARHYIWLRLAQVTTLDELRATVCHRLRARDPATWTGGIPKEAHE